MEDKNTDIIDLGKLIRKVWSRRKAFLFKIWPITFVLSCLIIICVPRYYTSEVKLAPEVGTPVNAGELGAIASSFGFDFSDVQNGDAISPLLYPDLMEDNGFVTSLFTIKVKDSDGEIDTDYYTYLSKHQKSAWWSEALGALKSLFKSKKKSAESKSTFDPYYLSKSDDDVAEAIRGNVRFSIDKKTGVISITVRAQDKLICRIVADSVSARLQNFITEYRTNKARIDLEFYSNILSVTKNEYDEAQRNYDTFVDANTNIVLQKFRGKEARLEREMLQKYNSYTTVSTQYDAARAKVQERTPAFTVLKGASVPLRAAGPKRMIFVIGMLFFVTFIGIFYIVKDDIKSALLQQD